jgi:hypothetical protein
MKGTVYCPVLLTDERLAALEAEFSGVVAKGIVQREPGDKFSHLVLGLVNALNRKVLTSPLPMKEMIRKICAAQTIVGLVLDDEGEAPTSTLLAIHRQLGGVLLLEGQQEVISD